MREPNDNEERATKEQWYRCRKAGLTVVVSKPAGAKHARGWICADAVEAMLTPRLGPDVDFDAAVITLREFEDE